MGCFCSVLDILCTAECMLLTIGPSGVHKQQERSVSLIRITPRFCSCTDCKSGTLILGKLLISISKIHIYFELLVLLVRWNILWESDLATVGTNVMVNLVLSNYKLFSTQDLLEFLAVWGTVLVRLFIFTGYNRDCMLSPVVYPEGSRDKQSVTCTCLVYTILYLHPYKEWPTFQSWMRRWWYCAFITKN